MTAKHGPLRRVVSNVAGVRGSASGDDARDRSGREVAELQAQVGYLEQEVSVLRRKLADSPRQVRALEDGLTQALEEVSALQMTHFPRAGDARDSNELPDAPVVI